MIKKVLAISFAVSMLSFALPALAANGSTACVGTAVSTREAAIGTAVTAFNQSVSSAYSTRAAALATAYGKNLGNGTLRTDIKAAWTAFTTSMTSARTAWRTSRNTAWSNFRTAVKACKATSVPTDSGNSGLEASGQ